MLPRAGRHRRHRLPRQTGRARPDRHARFIGEPGAGHRETFASASQAAAAGGVTTIICQPDTSPAIDDPATVDYVLRRARDTAIVHVHPMAAITKGLEGKEMTEIGLLKAAGAVAFTDGDKKRDQCTGDAARAHLRRRFRRTDRAITPRIPT